VKFNKNTISRMIKLSCTKENSDLDHCSISIHWYKKTVLTPDSTILVSSYSILKTLLNKSSNGHIYCFISIQMNYDIDLIMTLNYDVLR